MASPWRHLSAHTQPRRGLIPAAAAAGLAVVCVVAAVLVITRGSSTPATPACDGPPVSLHVLTAPDDEALLDEAARAFTATGPTVRGRCADVKVRGMDPAVAGQALARGWDGPADGPPPDVWVPPSSAWLHLLAGDDAAARMLPARQPSLARSPLVIAMPRPMAEALGWPDEPLSWGDLAAFARDPAGWEAHGHPEWGDFTLGMTDPSRSTAGLHAMLSMYAEVTGTPTALSEDAVGDPEVLRELLELEQVLDHQEGNTAALLVAQRAADAGGEGLGGLSAFPLSEQDVWDYNQGIVNPSRDGEPRPPRIPLAAFYPEGGAHELDYPYLVLSTDWANADRRVLAADFLEHLRADATWGLFRQAGFRAPGGSSGFAGSVDAGVMPDLPAATATRPAARVISEANERWSGLRERGTALLVVDTSGSMREEVPGQGATRLELAAGGATQALEVLTDGWRVGLWAFSGNGTPPHRALVPLGDVAGEVEGVPRGDVLAAELAALEPDGGTALYDTTLDAVRALRERWRPGGVNAVVLLTDGTHEDAGTLEREELLAALEADQEASPERPVEVIAFGYGDADMEALTAIAEATGGTAHHAQDPAGVSTALLRALDGGP